MDPLKLQPRLQRAESIHAAKILLMSIIVGATAFTVTAAVVPTFTVTFPLWMATIVGTVAGAFLAPITYAFLRHRPLEPAGWTLGGMVTVSSAVTAIFNPLLSLPVMLLSSIAAGLFICFTFPQKPLPHDPTRCANCGYDLAGLPTNTCPECGSRITSDSTLADSHH